MREYGIRSNQRYQYCREDERKKDISIRVADVLYVPRLRSNLLSMSKLNENDIKRTFEDMKADLIGSNEELIARAYEINGIYMLKSKLEIVGCQ